jgi:hypothetical protein
VGDAAGSVRLFDTEGKQREGGPRKGRSSVTALAWSEEVTIVKEQFQPEARARIASALTSNGIMRLEKGQVLTAVNRAGVLAQVEVFAESTVPLTTHFGRDGALDSASTSGATDGRAHLPPRQRAFRVGDFLAPMPLILAKGGGIEYSFVPGKKVRLGFLFDASPESLARVKLLGPTLELEPAKRSGDQGGVRHP